MGDGNSDRCAGLLPKVLLWQASSFLENWCIREGKEAGSSNCQVHSTLLLSPLLTSHRLRGWDQHWLSSRFPLLLSLHILVPS